MMMSMSMHGGSPLLHLLHLDLTIAYFEKDTSCPE